MADHMENKQANTHEHGNSKCLCKLSYNREKKKKANLHVNLSDVIVRKYTIVLHFT